MTAITVEHVAFAYNHVPILTDVSFSVATGQLACLLGPNGCGKTTLLRLSLGLLRPARGRVRLSGRDAAACPPGRLARIAAYVPQLGRPAFAYTALETTLMGRALHGGFRGRPSAEDKAIAMAALDRFSIAHLADRPLPRLSGGQRQLVMLARALAQQAPILIMDEPVNALDFGNQARFLEIVRELCDEGHTCLMTTHFPDHALWVADRVIMLRSGAVVADATPEAAVTSDNLQRLYDAAIDVHPLKNAMRVCVPARMGRLGPAAPRPAPTLAAGDRASH